MQIFVSYAFADGKIMNLMKECLQRREIEVYIAEHDLQLGKPLSRKIQNAIENSDALIAIVTRDKPSPSVNQEVGYATKAGIPVIPFVEREAKVGFMLGDIERVQFDENTVAQACEKVANYLIHQLGKTRENGDLVEDELLNLRKVIEDYEIYSYRLTKGSVLVGEIRTDNPVNVFLVNTRNLKLFEDQDAFDYDEGSDAVTRYSFRFVVPKTCEWHLIIENEREGDAEVDIKLRVVSDE